VRDASKILVVMKRSALIAAVTFCPKPADAGVGVVFNGAGYYAPGYYWGPNGYVYYAPVLASPSLVARSLGLSVDHFRTAALPPEEASSLPQFNRN
jgi:hypothetical protein